MQRHWRVGAPKLEILSDRIVDIAKQLGITKPGAVMKFRDEVLMGKKHSALPQFTPIG